MIIIRLNFFLSKKYLTFFLVFFFALNSQAQNEQTFLEKLKANPDTTAMRMGIKTAGKLRDMEPDSSLIILESIFPYISATSDEKIKAEYLNERGAVLNNLGRYDEAIKYLDLAETKYFELKDETGMASVANNKGNSLLRKGLPEEALKLFIKAEEGFLKMGKLKYAISAQQAQAATFIELGNFPMSLKLFRKAEESAMEINDQIGLLTIRVNMGSVYYYMNSFDTAAFYYKLVAQEAESLGKYDLQVAAYSNLSSVYFYTERLDESILYGEKALEIAKQKEDVGMQISVLNNLAGSYATINNYKKANELMDESIRLCDITNSLRSKLNVTKTKADILYQSGQGKEAYEWLLRHLDIKDSISTEESKAKAAELQAEHNEFKNEQEILALEKDQIISAKELELSKASEQKFIYLVVAIGAVLLMIVIAVIINFRKNKLLQSKNQLIEENLKEKEMLLMEVHHRVKNNLQMIYSILNMQTKDASEEAAALLHENKDRIRSISIIHEKLYMNEDITHANLNDLFREISENASKTSQHGTDTKIDVQCDPLKLDMDTLISLGILVNELVTNSLKYAFKSNAQNKISISLKKSGDEKISLSVADNGAGFPADFSLAKTTSFGFRMIQTMCKKLKGEIFVENTNGAVVKIDIHRFKTAS